VELSVFEGMQRNLVSTSVLRPSTTCIGNRSTAGEATQSRERGREEDGLAWLLPLPSH